MDLLRTSASTARVKILVVDDHPNTATTLARALSQASPNVDVFSATSGKQALEIIRDGAADILITDMIMPEMTGLELIEHLNNHPSGRPAFCFLITAYDVPGLTVSARRLKVKEVIVKPISPERICMIVARAIEELNQPIPSYREALSKQSFNLLIADDQPENLTLLSRYLGNEGYGLIKAKDGLETLEKVRSELPDLVLLDVNMPHKDGFAVLQEIRSDPATQHIPVIILTAARLDPIDIQSGLNMGADDYVTKPFDRRELLARIHTKLRVKQAEDTIRRRNRELNLLPEIGKELSARLDIQELADILLKRTVETFGAMWGHVTLLTANGTFQKTHHLGLQTSEFALPPGLLELVRETRQGHIINDAQNDSRWKAPNDETRSAVIVPMLGRYNLLGMLVLTHEQTDYFNLEHLLLLQAITSQASIGAENAQLYNTIMQEEHKLAAVLQSAADAILMFDTNRCLSLVNPAAQKLFTDYEVRIGQQLASGSGYDSFVELLDQTQHFGTAFSGEVVWPDQRVFVASMTPVKEDGIVVVLHDVTRFKELERVKDEFISTASHDLRNPLTSIKGFNALLKQAGTLNDNQSEFVERIHHAVENMEELVNNMLDLSKMDMGAEQKHETVNLTSLLWHLADEFQPYAESKKQLLVLGQTPANSMVSGDTLKISQALRNLIGNAIKYTPQGGVVMISLEQRTNMASVRIQDTGYGIPSEHLEHIFNRFYRVHGKGQADIEGNGLGLAIVKSIAEAHGGNVTVESEVGKGSCFTFSLPLMGTVKQNSSDQDIQV
jgi:signal transduction histidine kinase/DNA-binding response OmpR family regulator